MEKFKNGDIATVKCCKCGLLHNWTFKIVRGKFPDEDVVEMGIYLAEEKMPLLANQGNPDDRKRGHK